MNNPSSENSKLADEKFWQKKLATITAEFKAKWQAAGFGDIQASHDFNDAFISTIGDMLRKAKEKPQSIEDQKKLDSIGYMIKAIQNRTKDVARRSDPLHRSYAIETSGADSLGDKPLEKIEASFAACGQYSDSSLERMENSADLETALAWLDSKDPELALTLRSVIRNDWNRELTAKQLGCHERTVYRRENLAIKLMREWLSPTVEAT